MRYRVTMEVSETELKRLYDYERVIPVYREDVCADDLEFVENHFETGIVCEEFYDEYTREFENARILKKTDFYRLVQDMTGTVQKINRLTDNTIKNCFSH